MVVFSWLHCVLSPQLLTFNTTTEYLRQLLHAPSILHSNHHREHSRDCNIAHSPLNIYHQRVCTHCPLSTLIFWSTYYPSFHDPDIASFRTLSQASAPLTHKTVPSSSTPGFRFFSGMMQRTSWELGQGQYIGDATHDKVVGHKYCEHCTRSAVAAHWAACGCCCC